MSRAIWKGTVGFGLVNVPVALHTAAKDASNGVSMRQLHECVAGDAKKKIDRVVSTINQVTRCANDQCAKEVPRGELLKGYEHTKGQFVVVTEDDLRQAAVEGSKALEITEFVPVDQIDPRFFEQPYFLLPEKGGDKAYVLLREAIRKTGKIGLGLFAPRQNSLHVSAIMTHGDALVLSTMRWNDNVVPMESFSFPQMELNPKELKLAEQLVENLEADFDPTKYENTYRNSLMGIIEAKMSGETIEVATPNEAAATSTIDLMAVLEQSVAAGAAARKGLAKKVAGKRKTA